MAVWFQCLYCFEMQKRGDCCRWCSCECLEMRTAEDAENNGRQGRHINNLVKKW